MNPDEPQTPESIDPPRNDSAEPSSGSSLFSSSQPLRQPLALGEIGGGGRTEVEDLTRRVAELQRQEKALQQEIASLQASYNSMLQKQIAEAQLAIGRLVKEGVSDLEQRKQTLQLAVEQLERRQERIRNEMRTTFAGASQDLAVRVQGFKDYLVGSLQDLAVAAEQLQLSQTTEEPKRPLGAKSEARTEIRTEAKSESRTEGVRSSSPRSEGIDSEAVTPKFAEQGFQEQAKRIRKLLDQYRSSPDYYGPPWQLRRTFEPIHAERVSNWFFTQGGRGAIRTMGSRLQNILIASATISVLNELYGERLRPLILGNSPERLGEWRRGLQDCLGVSRADFGIDEGIVLFEAPEPLVQRADRLVKQKQLPLIIIDETEEFISVSLLQFPLWLAFAPDPAAPNPMMY
jgi:chaperonin cofactor prefoldin